MSSKVCASSKVCPGHPVLQDHTCMQCSTCRDHTYQTLDSNTLQVGHLRQWTTAHEQPQHSGSDSSGLVTATWTLTACVDRPVSIRWSSRERHTHCADQTRRLVLSHSGIRSQEDIPDKDWHVYTGKSESTSPVTKPLESLPECHSCSCADDQHRAWESWIWWV